MRPAQLTPPHWVPVVGTVAVGDKNTGKSLTQQLTGHLPTPRQLHHKHGHKARHRHPEPRPFVTLAPAGLVEVGYRLRFNASAGFLDGWGYHLCRSFLRLADRPRTHRHTEHVVHHLASHAFGQTIRPRA